MRRWIAVGGDVFLAAVVTLYGTVSLATSADPTGLAREPDAIAYFLAVALAAPLAVRKRWPLQVLGVFLVGMVVYAVRGYVDGNADFFGPIIGLYTVASMRPLRTAIGAAVLSATTVGVAFIVEPHLSPTAADWLTVVAFIGGTTFVGDSVRRRRAYAAALESRTNELEAARLELAQRAVTEERLRMARELHDVVAHTMTAIVVQSAVAQRSLGVNPAQAGSALANIETMSRDGLNELRSILNVLRSDEDEGAELAPVARLADLDGLVERLRGGGMDLAIRREGDLDGLSPLVELAAYRIVQESLTNALRYANDARVQVTIRGHGAKLWIEVRDDGSSAAARASSLTGSGKGLAGMAERATLLGGTFEAGRMPGGGFRVAATLPRAGTS